MESKIVFVTGATGFIGSNMVRRLLNDGHDVHVSARKSSDMWRIKEIAKDLHFHYPDINDYDSIEKTILKIKPDIIYHLATYGGYPFQSDNDKIIKTNLIGTINILRACLKTDMQCFVNTGTSSEYGMKSVPIKETDFLEPVSCYAFSKAAATLYCCMTAKSIEAPIVTIRPFSAYGYYEEPSRLIPHVISSYLKNKRPILSSKSSVRDYVFIEDVIEGYILAANNPRAYGGIINIGYGKQYTISEVVEKIKHIVGTGVEPDWGNIETRPNEPKVWIADITKAKNLGWEPKHTIDEGLIKTVEWFRNNLDLYDAVAHKNAIR